MDSLRTLIILLLISANQFALGPWCCFKLCEIYKYDRFAFMSSYKSFIIMFRKPWLSTELSGTSTGVSLPGETDPLISYSLYSASTSFVSALLDYHSVLTASEIHFYKMNNDLLQITLTFNKAICRHTQLSHSLQNTYRELYPHVQRTKEHAPME